MSGRQHFGRAYRFRPKEFVMKSCNRGILASICFFVTVTGGCDVGEDRSSTGALGQPISCSSGCTLSPTPPTGAPESSATVWSTTSGGGGGINWNSGDWDVTLPLTAGDQVSSVAVLVRDNGSANGHASDSNNVIANLQSRVSGGAVSNLGFFTSTGSGAQQTLNVVLSAPHTLVTGETVWLQLIPLVGGALPHVATIDSWVGTVTVQSPAPVPQTPQQQVTRSWSIVPGAIDVQQGTATCAAGNNTSLSANGSFWIPIPGVAQNETITSLALFFQGNSIPNVAGLSLWVSDSQGNGNVNQVTGVAFTNTSGQGTGGGAWLKAAMTGSPSTALTPLGVSQFFLFVQTNAGGTTSVTAGSYTVVRS